MKDKRERKQNWIRNASAYSNLKPVKGKREPNPKRKASVL